MNIKGNSLDYSSFACFCLISFLSWHDGLLCGPLGFNKSNPRKSVGGIGQQMASDAIATNQGQLELFHGISTRFMPWISEGVKQWRLEQDES